MCGIAGFYGDFSSASLLGRMSSLIAHRGPDGDGSYLNQDATCGLAHRRLAILDPSPCGQQPMWDRSRRVVIVYNGELYNFRELRQELSADGFTFHTECDTEVVLSMYIRHGRTMLERLNGIFAFALWDTEHRELFLARDHFGVKPLYFAETPRGFLFASELKALLAEPSLDTEISHEALHYYLTYLWAPAPHTPLKQVHKLEPGAALVVKDRGSSVHRQT